MTVTAQQLITRAYRTAGAVSSGDDPTADELSDGLEALNDMLANWAQEHVSVGYEENEAFTLTIGDNSYLISSTSAEFNTKPPLAINAAWLTDGDQTYPFSIIDAGEYSRTSNKEEIGRPGRGWYKLEGAEGRLILDRRPDSAYVVHLVSVKEFDEFSTLSTTSVLATAYNRAIRFNLAVEIGSELGAPLDPRVIKIADDSYSALKRANLARRVQNLGVDAGLLREGRYDIAGDSY